VELQDQVVQVVNLAQVVRLEAAVHPQLQVVVEPVDQDLQDQVVQVEHQDQAEHQDQVVAVVSQDQVDQVDQVVQLVHRDQVVQVEQVQQAHKAPVDQAA
jgi:hypothetical protein